MGMFPRPERTRSRLCQHWERVCVHREWWHERCVDPSAGGAAPRPRTCRCLGAASATAFAFGGDGAGPHGSCRVVQASLLVPTPGRARVFFPWCACTAASGRPIAPTESERIRGAQAPTSRTVHPPRSSTHRPRAGASLSSGCRASPGIAPEGRLGPERLHGDRIATGAMSLRCLRERAYRSGGWH